VAEPEYIDNQIDGANGGPVKRDLFYFASFEGTGYSQDATVVGEASDAIMRTGNFVGFSDNLFVLLTHRCGHLHPSLAFTESEEIRKWSPDLSARLSRPPDLFTALSRSTDVTR
jgi:hypothetical protein